LPARLPGQRRRHPRRHVRPARPPAGPVPARLTTPATFSDRRQAAGAPAPEPVRRHWVWPERKTGCQTLVAFARLLARMETMPVIEQAKGIVMAQQGCRPDEAFDLLRRISQRTGVKVHVLAAEIVEQVASGCDGSNVTPISLGATRYGRSSARARAGRG